MKAEVDKPDINKLLNVPARLNNLKTRADNLIDGKLKTDPVDLKKLSNVLDNKIVKNTTFNRKVNNLDKKILMQLL